METLETFSLSSNKLNKEGSYYKIGRGTPLILLHGFAETFEIWDTIYPQLSKHYSVIIPEIPACGNDNSFKENISIEGIAYFINEILVQENISQAIICGHSMGGYAAMAFAEKYPDKLKGLSLIHSSAQGDSNKKKHVRQSAINFIKKNGKEPFLKTLLPKLYANTQGLENLFTRHKSMAEQYSNEQIIACYQAMIQRKDREHILSNLNCPILFIVGKEDASIHYQRIEAQSNQCKKPFLTIFEGIGHTSMHENPSLLLNTIFGFLDDIKQTKNS